MIRVAVADDSSFTCRLVASYLEESGGCKVVGMAHDAPSTVDLVRRASPDVLTLDLEMPGAGGLDLLQRVVEETSAAVVVVSGVTRRAAATTLRALELGALDFVLKYTPEAPSSPASLRREIVAKVKMAAAAAPRARHGLREWHAANPAVPRRRPCAPAHVADARGDSVIVIGSSTGGPVALRELLAELPADFPTPCVVVQHLPAMFTSALAAQLERHVRLPVREAQMIDRLGTGQVLVTPGARHLLLRPGRRIELRPAAAEDVYRPSIDLAMTSAAETYGPGVTGVVLSGMGSDGAEGLSRIRTAGGETYVQDPASCVVASMPARALARAGADHIASPDRIGSLLATRGQPS